jgi:hypothetical protein
MSAIKEIYDLLSNLHEKIKDRHSFDRYRQVKELVEKVEDENLSLKRENTALHEQMGIARVKAADGLLAKEEENAVLRIEIRSLKMDIQVARYSATAVPATVIQGLDSSAADLVSSAQGTLRIPMSETTNQPPKQIEVELDKGTARNLSQNPSSETASPGEIFEVYLALVIRRSISAIRIDLNSRKAKTASRPEMLGTIQAANPNEPIDYDETFDSLVSKEFLKRSYGDRFALTANAYNLLGESK